MSTAPALLRTLAPALLLALAACPGPVPEEPDAGCDRPCGEACCPEGEACNADQVCAACTPGCAGKACGADDGCGGQCHGSCPGADAGAAGPDAGPIGPSVTFKVMDWNVHDFFDESDDPAKNDTVMTATQVSSKLTRLATVINKQAPDVLTLQEVESKDLLRRLNDKLTVKLPNYELIPGRDPRGINVAIMSRWPLVKTATHQNERLYSPDGRGPYSWSRDCLEAHVDVGGNRVAAFLVNHLISQLDSTIDTDFKRQAQAQGIRDIADALRGSTPWIATFLTGDMNDDPGSPSSSILFAGGAFVDLFAGQAMSAVWTTKEGTKLYRYDYLIPDKVTAGWKQSAAVVHSTDTTAASDHEPVVASFRFP